MSEVPWYVSLIISWLPFLVIVGALMWTGLTSSRATRVLADKLTTPEGTSFAQLIEQCGRELKRSNDLSEQTVSDLRTRLEALEKRG
jgi:hypothetical protein